MRLICMSCGEFQNTAKQCECGCTDFTDYQRYWRHLELTWQTEPKIKRTMTAREREVSKRFGSTAHLLRPTVHTDWNGRQTVKWSFWKYL